MTRLEDVGALVEDNLFERDILIATKILGSSPNITERTQGNKPASLAVQKNAFNIVFLSASWRRSVSSLDLIFDV